MSLLFDASTFFLSSNHMCTRYPREARYEPNAPPRTTHNEQLSQRAVPFQWGSFSAATFPTIASQIWPSQPACHAGALRPVKVVKPDQKAEQSESADTVNTDPLRIAMITHPVTVRTKTPPYNAAILQRVLSYVQLKHTALRQEASLLKQFHTFVATYPEIHMYAVGCQMALFIESSQEDRKLKNSSCVTMSRNLLAIMQREAADTGITGLSGFRAYTEAKELQSMEDDVNHAVDISHPQLVELLSKCHSMPIRNTIWVMSTSSGRGEDLAHIRALKLDPSRRELAVDWGKTKTARRLAHRMSQTYPWIEGVSLTRTQIEWLGCDSVKFADNRVINAYLRDYCAKISVDPPYTSYTFRRYAVQRFAVLCSRLNDSGVRVTDWDTVIGFTGHADATMPKNVYQRLSTAQVQAIIDSQCAELTTPDAEGIAVHSDS